MRALPVVRGRAGGAASLLAAQRARPLRAKDPSRSNNNGASQSFEEEEAWETYKRRRNGNRNGNGSGSASGAEKAASRNGSTASTASTASGLISMDEEGTWREQGFPFYQKGDEEAWDWGHVDKDHDYYNPVWTCIRKQAEEQSRKEPLLSSYLYSSVLSHQTFEKALANVLANSIGDRNLMSTQLFPNFLGVLQKDEVRKAALLDLQVTKDRDPACTSYLEALLNYKGYQALQLHRIAHDFHCNGREVMAQMLQSRSSEVYGVDIHPGANFGKGILIDHGTGVVVGETAVIGDNSSLLQGVTLGGTGKASGDRHPKLGKNVLVGAQATVLGNISIGEGSMVAAGSVVLKDVPASTLIAGIPAKIVGNTSGMPSTLMDQICNMKTKDEADTALEKYEDFEGIEYFL